MVGILSHYSPLPLRHPRTTSPLLPIYPLPLPPPTLRTLSHSSAPNHPSTAHALLLSPLSPPAPRPALPTPHSTLPTSTRRLHRIPHTPTTHTHPLLLPGDPRILLTVDRTHERMVRAGGGALALRCDTGNDSPTSKTNTVVPPLQPRVPTYNLRPPVHHPSYLVRTPNHLN